MFFNFSQFESVGNLSGVKELCSVAHHTLFRLGSGKNALLEELKTNERENFCVLGEKVRMCPNGVPGPSTSAPLTSAPLPSSP